MSWVETKTNNNHEKQFQMENQHISCQKKKNMSTLMIIFSEKIEFDQTLFFLDFFCFCQVFFCFRLWLTGYSLTKGTIVDEIK